MRRILSFAMAGTLALAGAACDSDENGGEGDLEAYCALTAAVGDEEAPTDAQLDAIEDAAPPEIEDEINTAADGFRNADPENPESVFDDPDVVAAVEDIEAFDDENCPEQDGDDGDTGDTDDTTDTGDTDEPDDAEDPDTTEDTTDDTTDETTDDTADDTTETS